MNTQRTRNTDTQANMAEALRIAQERLAALRANELPVAEIHFIRDPGPDYTPRRTWR